jgi:hypothetical protein
MSTMRILDLQQRAREIGRLRLGAMKGGRPVSLDTWRFTSTNQEFIQWCATTYGGEATPWQSPAGDAWEVITEAAVIEAPGRVRFSRLDAGIGDADLDLAPRIEARDDADAPRRGGFDRHGQQVAHDLA